MISEPEMAGEFEASAASEVLVHSGPRPAGDRPPRVPRPRGRWVWALGGAVVASAVWGAVLFAGGSRDGAPDMHGYRLGKDPCGAVGLKSIGAAIAPRGPETEFGTEMLRHSALDQAQCWIPLRTEAGSSVEYTVTVKVALHKKSDPGAEFEAGRSMTDFGVAPETEVEVVAELGDKAYLLSFEDGQQELRVLEGGAVLSLRLTANTGYWSGDDGEPPADKEEQPDLAPHKAAMISDMRDLMTDLKG